MSRSAKLFDKCEVCASTGILTATLVKEEGTNNSVGIVAKLCGEHYNHSLAEKNVMAMEKITGLKVEVVKPEKKSGQ